MMSSRARCNTECCGADPGSDPALRSGPGSALHQPAAAGRCNPSGMTSWRKSRASAHQAQGRFGVAGFFLADKIDADALVVMARDASGETGDQHEFPDLGTDIG